MSTPKIVVKHAVPDHARPWSPPGSATRVKLVDSCTGESPRLETNVSIFHDGTRLLVIFTMEDDGVVASISGRDAELWREDAVEIFLQPEEGDSYYEFEASPNGSIFDARVRFPGPTRQTMSVDVGWDCAGFSSAVRRHQGPLGDESLEILVSIPFSGLGCAAPEAGDSWRANFYRIDRSSRGDMFAAWSPTLTPRPDFHLPQRFGTLTFA